jgi:hypothetical protein
MTRMLPIDSHLGHWERHLWRPAAGGALEGVIDQAQYFDGTAKHRLGRVLPHASIKLVVSLDQPYGEVTPRAVTPFAWAYLAGVPTGPVTIEAPDRRVRTLNVRLHPTSVHRLLGLPLSELTGRAVDLRDLFGPGSAELLERCHETNGQQECVACLVRWLDEALQRSEQPDATGSAVAWAAGRIERSGGTVSVTALREHSPRPGSLRRSASGWASPRSVTRGWCGFAGPSPCCTSLGNAPSPMSPSWRATSTRRI